MGVSVWRPKLLKNGYIAIDLLTFSRSAPAAWSPAVQQASNSKAKFEWMWRDVGPGESGSLSKARAPAGYVALSDATVHMSNSDVACGTTKLLMDIDPWFRCVRASLIKEDDVDGCVLRDAGSEWKRDGVCWTIQSCLGMHMLRGGREDLDNHLYKLKEFMGHFYRDMKLMYSIGNLHHPCKLKEIMGHFYKDTALTHECIIRQGRLFRDCCQVLVWSRVNAWSNQKYFSCPMSRFVWHTAVLC